VRFRVFLRPCSVHWSRRAVTAGVANPATIPLRRFLPGRHPPVWHAPLRFSQRLAPTSFLSRCRRRLAGHSSPVSLLARRTGPAGSFSRPGRTHRGASADTRGVRCPFAALILPAGEGVFPRLGPTCRLVRSSAASVLARGCRDKPSRRCWRQDVRLLGFCPAGKPFPAVHRPRYSFCAEGRRDARAVAALGFVSSFRSSESRAAGLHFWRPFRLGLGRCCPLAFWGACA
jgi:hypothetical protein